MKKCETCGKSVKRRSRCCTCGKMSCTDCARYEHSPIMCYINHVELLYGDTCRNFVEKSIPALDEKLFGRYHVSVATHVV